jgi:RNA polymerase sigma-70 factor (ECF subfamily)
MQERIGRHHAEIVAFLARRAPDAAEELAQEVWFRMARARPDCPTDAEFRAYAYAVARRLLVDHHRRRCARIELVPLDGGVRPHEAVDAGRPDSAMDAGEILEVVESTLGAMKPALAEVFRWRTTEDVSYKEIARRQDTNVNTALGRMHQATRKIRRALVDAGLIGGSA